MPKRILCIHAHPDDAEIFAAGTLALLARKGHAVTIVTMTAGDCGSNHIPPDEIAAIRRNEAARAAALLGAEYLWAGFKDLSIYVDDAARRRVTGILRKVRPDLVLTASPIDYHCDHEATSSLARDACFGCSCTNYMAPEYPDEKPLTAIPHLYFVDPAEGTDVDQNPIVPDFVVNISSTFELKKQMLACHESQRQWLLEQHGMENYLETMAEWSRRSGRYGGFEYGEGFRIYRGHPYPQSPLLEELLGEELIARCGR